MKRKHYIDNLRWLCIMLLIPYHAAMCFNCWGETNYLFFGENSILSACILGTSPWYMPLLMVLAGASAKFSLSKRTTAEFVKERVCKLFLPLIFGILTIIPALTYFADRSHNNYSGSYFAHYKIFFTTVTDLTGYDGGFTPGHLWFLLYLFVISLISLPFIKSKKLELLSNKVNLPIFILLGFLPLAASPVLNFGGKGVLSYLLFYLIGYYFISKDIFVKEKIVKYRIVYLLLFIVFDVLNIYAGLHDKNGALNTVIYYAASLFGILTFLGFAFTFFNMQNKLTKYLSSVSFSFYIFHYTWLTAIQYYLYKATDNNLILFFVPVIGSFFMTFVTCEVIRRIKQFIRTQTEKN